MIQDLLKKWSELEPERCWVYEGDFLIDVKEIGWWKILLSSVRAAVVVMSQEPAVALLTAYLQWIQEVSNP